MSIEIMSVSLSDETIDRLVTALTDRMRGGSQPTTQSNPGSSQNPQDAGGPGSGGQGDPWLNSNGGQQNQGYQNQNNGQQYQQNQQQGQYQGGPQQQGGQNCAHGTMLWQPPGQNRNTGESYDGYFKCPLQRGAQGRCRNVYPGR